MRNTQDEVDLGLSLGLGNYRASTDEIGAGVNANSGIAFAASDPAVAELVWSPHNGLSLKCTGPSSTRMEMPFVLWNVGPDGREEDGVNLNVSPVMLDSDRDIVVGDSSRKDDEVGTSNPFLADDAHDKSEGVAESNTIANGKGDMDMDAKFSCKAMARKCFGGYGKVKINACKSDVMGLNVENLRHRASKISEDLAYSLPNIKNREEAEEEVTSSNKNNEIIPESPVPIDAIPLDNIDCSAENDKDFRERRPDKDVTVGGIFLHQQRKGKEKVVSEGDEHGRLLDNDQEDSNESVESCNNVGFFSKGVKRGNCHDEETSYSGSKRARKEAQGSFTNWMSNMVKGLSCGDNKEDQCSFPLSLALARTNDLTSKRRHDYGGSTSKGFKKVFRSLYCHTKMMDRKEGYFIEEPPEEANTVEPKLIENHPLDGKNSCMQIIVSNEEVGQDTSRNTSNKPGETSSCEPNCASLACEGDLGKSKVLNHALGSDSLCNPCNNQAEASNLNIPATSSHMPGKCNDHTSLWITRFCSRNVALDQHGKETTEEDSVDKLTSRTDQKASGFGHDLPENEDCEACFSFKQTSRVSPLARFQKARSPDEMASTFMRRLDALRQGSLHLRQLSDGKENISNYDVREENHHEPSHEARGNGKAPLRSFSTHLTWNVKEKSDNSRPSDSNGIRKGGDLNIGICQKDVNTKEQPQSESSAMPEMFLAISKLWLSRSDILRWMNSNASTKYLNGFFLRLRLGKLEEGIGETGYYVACITAGDAPKNSNGLKSKKSILVDVGGIKTCIESQYISNHNFLEDEIKTWWCKTVKSGGKIPSLHDLNSKFQDRKHLGF